MWWWWWILIVLYLACTYWSLQQASSPVRVCSADAAKDACWHSLLPKEEEKLELQLFLQHNNSWEPSCQLEFSYRPGIVSNGTTLCTVNIPNVFRQRISTQSTPSTPRPLQGKFRLVNGNQTLNEAWFTMTTFRRRKNEQSPSNASSEQWVPHLKYGKAPVRIRLVEEVRPYGFLERQDGIRLYPYNWTHYRPQLYVDDNSLRHSSRLELAEESKPFNMTVRFTAISPMVDTINHQVVRQGLKMLESVVGENAEELDEIRYFIADERLYRFACSQIITTVHVWLEYLAFSSEIRFYRGRRKLTGVSVSTVTSNLICSLIIFLYLLDGGETSWVILLSLLVSVLVEAWKVGKLLHPSFQTSYPFVVWHTPGSSGTATPLERDVMTYDLIAIRYLSYFLYPVVGCWSLYSWYQYTYKSWWSWCISNLANAVYTFGFISLCPQLYVNYRMKSVTHLPWKVFAYKLFTTFVDDAFAWLVEMPWKHRIMTLRDDVVLMGLLYQVYIYRTDKTRTNEYGYSYEDDTNTIYESTKAVPLSTDDPKLKSE